MGRPFITLSSRPLAPQGLEMLFVLAANLCWKRNVKTLTNCMIAIVCLHHRAGRGNLQEIVAVRIKASGLGTGDPHGETYDLISIGWYKPKGIGADVMISRPNPMLAFYTATTG